MKASRLFVISLIFLGLGLRLYPILPGAFSFLYDNSRDSLVIMEMGRYFKPALYGAVTSIPGVYNGPLYYYLALPLNILLNYHPIAGVLTISVLAAASILLIYRSWGWLAAVLYVTAVGVIGTQQSAWTPYMTPFVTLPVVIILEKLIGLKTADQKLKKSQASSKLSHTENVQRWVGKLFQNTTVLIALLAIMVSSAFHFQTAFGVVLLPLSVLVLILFSIRLSWKQVLIASVAFALPFTPFMIFELRHSFHQTKQIIGFVQNYQDQAQVIGDNSTGLGRYTEIFWYLVKSSNGSLLPLPVSDVFGMVFFGITAGYWVSLGAKYVRADSKSKNFLKGTQEYRVAIMSSTFLLGSTLLYFVLPAKEYYFVALIPVWIYQWSFVLRTYAPLKWQMKIAILLVMGSMYRAHQNKQEYDQKLQDSAMSYQVKQSAIDTVLEKAAQPDRAGERFASYHFTPEIYDYTYQHLYLRQVGRAGQTPTPFPVEFSYAPGEISYIPQKKVGLQPLAVAELDRVYLITESPHSDDVYDEWWNRVTAGLEIVDETQLNQAVTLFEAVPVIEENDAPPLETEN